MRTRRKEILEEVEPQDPIKEIYHSSPSFGEGIDYNKVFNESLSKDPIDMIIEERKKKALENEIPYKDEEKMKMWNKRDVLNRMFQLVRYERDLDFAISEELYYLYHTLSASDQHLFEVWFNKYR